MALPDSPFSAAASHPTLPTPPPTEASEAAADIAEEIAFDPSWPHRLPAETTLQFRPYEGLDAALAPSRQVTSTAADLPQAADLATAADLIAQAAPSSDVPWRFVLEPYLYLPFETSGDITIRGLEVPYNFGLGDVIDSLTFAFYGRFEAWKGPWGFMLDGYYFDTVESDSRQLTTPPGIQGLPPQITVNGTAETSFVKFDFVGAYRLGDGNLPSALPTADTEFDLGPFIFDILAGLRLYSFSNDIQLTSSIGQRFNVGRSDTFVEPLIGGRARWNFSDSLAGVIAANISGFGIGTDISIESYAGIDWLFSGNTSLTAMYRLSYIDYTQGNSGFNFFQHGPALGVRFRF